MKTKRIGARLSALNINKVMRFFCYPTWRELLEAVIELCEDNSYIKNKINAKIQEKR